MERSNNNDEGDPMANELTIDEAIARFGVSRSTLMRWIKEGKVNSRRQGRRRFILVEPDVGTQAAWVSPTETAAVREASCDPPEMIDAPLSIRERPEETVLVVMRDRVEQIERERDLAIRRFGQLEEAVSHLSFWRRGMLAMLASFLLATVGGVTAWTWAWNELATSRTEAQLNRMERDHLGTKLEEVKGILAETRNGLESERQVFAEERSRYLTKLDIFEATLGEERAERTRLAQDLATAVTEAAAMDLTASHMAQTKQAEIGRLRLQLADAQATSEELGPDADSGSGNSGSENSDLGNAAETEATQATPANTSGTEMYGPPLPRGMRASNDE